MAHMCLIVNRHLKIKFVIFSSETDSPNVNLPTLTPPPTLPGPPSDRLRTFYDSVPELLDTWLGRRTSPHTQRAYRSDVLSFVGFLRLPWPQEAGALFSATVRDVQEFRCHLLTHGAAPKTINRRISSLSSFYRFLGSCAAELRLPIQVANPASAVFIARAAPDAQRETHALSAEAARQLLALPEGAGVQALRDRAILSVYLYTGIRLMTGCRLELGDFAWDGSQATLRLHEKGGRVRRIGLHYAAARAVDEYLRSSGLSEGPLFRPLRGFHLGRPMSAVTMYGTILGYLSKLPGAVRLQNGKPRCLYTPHSLRATTATLLLEHGADITKVQELLGHRYVTTTQLYDKRRRSMAEGASHQVPL
jgi:site-specific recombinase XerD